MQEKTDKSGVIARLFRLIIPVGNLRAQLRTAFVALVLLVVTILTASTVVIGFQTGRDRVVAQLDAIAENVEAEINTWAQKLQTELAILTVQESANRRMQTLLGPSAFREILSGELRQNFQAMVDLTADFSEIFLLNTEGQVIVSTDPDQEGKIFAQDQFFLAGLEAPFIQPPRYYPALDETSVIVAQPIYHPQGFVIGVLAGRANLEQLSAITSRRSQFGKTSDTYLVGFNNALLTPLQDVNLSPRSSYVRSTGINAVLENKTNSIGLFDNYQGSPVIGVYRWLPELQVALVAEQAQNEAFAAVNITLFISIGIAIGALIVAVLLAIWVTRSVTRPLSQLANTSSQIAAGNLTLRADTSRQDEIGELAQAFNQMTDQLRQSITNLEDRVSDRTQALEIEAEISSKIISLLDVNEMLQYTVDQLQTRFHYYHTHIYLVDEEANDLVMVAGYGDIGRELKARGHRLQVGTGIVGNVVAANSSFVSNDVLTMPNFVHNTLLPDTRSELAVPLRKGNSVLGVLDMHCAAPDRFTSEDVDLMQSIANVTAVAVDNARLLLETQRALQEVERLNRQLTQDTWEEFNQGLPSKGYHYKWGATSPISGDADVWLSPMQQAVGTRQLVKEVQPGNGVQNKSELAIPLLLRNQVIGVLGVKRESTPVWADEEIAAVEAVAGQVARALENARLSKEQEKTIVQLKELDRLKSEFLTSMSHELRTPLNSIIGFADVLLQGIDGDLPELALHDVQLIYNSGQHLLALINDVLDLSKIEADRMELVLEDVSMADIVSDVLASTSSLLKGKQVEVITNVAHDLPLVNADRLRLSQVLINLVSNATKFTSEGSITIDARVPEDDNSKMRVAVTDTGIGIPSDKQKTVFDRFRQADSSTTRKYGGTGLGLAISKRLVEMHGGEVGVISEEGRGAEFYFTVPLTTVH
jgi:signal transduction histidine kinase